MTMKINTEKCLGCAACQAACPLSAIEIKNDKAVFDWSICTECGDCIEACPLKLIQMV